MGWRVGVVNGSFNCCKTFSLKGLFDVLPFRLRLTPALRRCLTTTSWWEARIQYLWFEFIEAYDYSVGFLVLVSYFWDYYVNSWALANLPQYFAAEKKSGHEKWWRFYAFIHPSTTEVFPDNKDVNPENHRTISWSTISPTSLLEEPKRSPKGLGLEVGTGRPLNF